MSVASRFADRRDAGRRLAARVAELALVDPVVLGLPRGGVPVAFEVAARLGAPLDVVVARKVGAPGQPEFAIAAIAERGVRVADPATLARIGISDQDLDRRARAEEDELDRRVAAYRGTHVGLPVQGRDVVVVDDGLATGLTAEAAVLAVRRAEAARVVLAAPVCAPEAARRLASVADEVVCVEQPDDLVAVGQWYDDFDQTTDGEVIALLGRSRTRPPGPAP